MQLCSLSPCITTLRVEESRDFYVEHFGARVTFDCGWYVNLEFEGNGSLQFMSPQSEQPPCDPAGLTCNLRVEDVDAEHRRLVSSGLSAIMPLEDHPWGDRGFAIRDPNGMVLYIYSDREPAPEFMPFYKTGGRRDR